MVIYYIYSEMKLCECRSALSKVVLILLSYYYKQLVDSCWFNIVASEDLQELIGPTSYYDRWLRWQSQTQMQQTYQHVVDELTKALQVEPVELYSNVQ